MHHECQDVIPVCIAVLLKEKYFIVLFVETLKIPSTKEPSPWFALMHCHHLFRKGEIHISLTLNMFALETVKHVVLYCPLYRDHCSL